jgi:hypothetical protein
LKFPETQRQRVCLGVAPKGTVACIYDLLNDAVSGPDYVASIGRMFNEIINWKQCVRKWAWSNLRY